MARTDRFYIGQLQGTGLQTDVRPYAIADDAFAQLNNAYVFRGRLRKRFGSYLLNQSVDSSVAQLYSRFRVNIDTTDGNGDASGTVPGAIFEIGQQFSVGDEIFTVYQNGAMLSTGAGTGTFNTATGAYSITGADATTDVYFYPAQPVMGLPTYETDSINDEQVIGFDTQFAYQYINGAWERLDQEGTAGAAEWTGTNADFFWAANYRGIESYETYLFVTNFVAADVMRYYDGTQWEFFNPEFNSASDTITTCRLITYFKDRLVLLNIVENISASDESFVNRARFSQNGSPFDADAWKEDVPGRGGYIDAPTKEQIVSCEFLNDRLIVYFESSTWELAYTGNQILPFVWQKINTELGCESTFSIVPFDKAVLGVGNVGVHACNGISVQRIDDKIPDEVFKISNSNEGVYRVAGIRDYYTELVYWTFPSEDSNEIFPDRILVYNYKTGSWAFFDDSITAWGYFQQPLGLTWAQMKQTWESADVIWSSGSLKAKFRQIIAGNQEGFTFIASADYPTRNAPALSITDLSFDAGTLLVTVTCINHNLNAGDYVLIESCQGSTTLNDSIYQIFSYIDSDNFTIYESGFTGNYTGGGTVARVSQLDVYTKQYNFYAQQGLNASINKVDFFLDKTENGEFTADYFISSSEQSMLVNGLNTGALLGTGVVTTYPYELIPFENGQSRLWHPIYPMANGECIQLRLYFNNEQMLDKDIAFSDWQLHAMTFYAMPTSRLS